MNFESSDELNNRLLQITPGLAIPREELQFRTSRSSGPGGQHVNKVETRVELFFDIAASSSLTEDQRQLLLTELRTWLDTAGVLRLVSDVHRSQLRNREEAVARFVFLLQEALRPRKIRKARRVPRSVKEARLESKHHRSEVKRRRASGKGED